jgi:hypothetical protein
MYQIARQLAGTLRDHPAPVGCRGQSRRRVVPSRRGCERHCLNPAIVEYEGGHDTSFSNMERGMKYADGQEVRLGDRVKLGQDDGGVVVALIDTGEYTDDHSQAQWGYLNKGAMIKFPLHGLIHYEDAEPDLQLMELAPWR